MIFDLKGLCYWNRIQLAAVFRTRMVVSTCKKQFFSGAVVDPHPFQFELIYLPSDSCFCFISKMIKEPAGSFMF